MDSRDEKAQIKKRQNAERARNPIEGLSEKWVPISKRTSTITLKSKVLNCKRQQFPLVEACAITIHKSQSGTYDTVIYEYDLTHEQQLVYVALSRTTSLQGLYLTNKKGDHTFHHARGKVNSELSSEFRHLENHKLETIGDKSRQFMDQVLNSPTPLSLLTFNVQSLRAHVEDISTDSVLSQFKIMALSETWIENGENVQLPGYKQVSQLKRNIVRAGGVAIYEREDSDMQATEYDLLKYEESKVQIKQMATAHDAVGDICAIQTTINGERAILVNVYITPNSGINKIREFVVFNMMAYSPKIAGLFEEIDKYGYYKIPMILGGYMNIDLKSDNGKMFLEFLQENWHLQLNNDPEISTTRNNTCIDGVFTRLINYRH